VVVASGVVWLLTGLSWFRQVGIKAPAGALNRRFGAAFTGGRLITRRGGRERARPTRKASRRSPVGPPRGVVVVAVCGRGVVAGCALTGGVRGAFLGCD